jgi:hypothetical protein
VTVGVPSRYVAALVRVAGASAASSASGTLAPLGVRTVS